MSVIIGAITVYAGVYIGGPLYCGGTYDAATTPWIAIDVNQYDYWHCGDRVLVLGDGWEYEAVILDAGTFNGYYIEQWGSDVPIIADIPAIHSPFSGLSAMGVVVNLSEMERQRLWKVVN
jgi:hypothetical protein